MRRLLLAALLLPVFAGCRVPEEPGLLVHDTGTLRIELIDPAIPADVRKTGCRFLRGGWLRGVYPHGSQRSILRTRSVHPRLPAFGFPFEFYPAPELAFGTERGIRPGFSSASALSARRAKAGSKPSRSNCSRGGARRRTRGE